MPQTPPERKLDLSAEPPRKAGVIPFERPQNDAQRSVRQRVQERLDRERVVMKPRIRPLRLVLTLAVAIIPVVLTFGASDAVLRKVQLLTRLYTAESNTTQQAPAPAEEETPGLLFMMPDPTLNPGPPQVAAPPAGTPQAAQPSQKPAPQK